MLTDTDRQRVALGLVFLRFLGHTAACTAASEDWRDEILRLATRVGCRAEFVQALLDTPVSSVTVKDLDGKPKRATPRAAGKGGKYRQRRPGINVGPLRTPASS